MPSIAGLNSVAHPKVLIVEDDPVLCTFYRSALQIAGYVVVTADDGISALRQIDGGVPEALVLDLGLPRLSGRDVGREVAHHLPQLPIVVVTGSAEEIDPDEFACVLRKPITAVALIDAVEDCLLRVRAGRSATATAHDRPSPPVRKPREIVSPERLRLRLRR
jgi:DNA-binding response OmpR family regulator